MANYIRENPFDPEYALPDNVRLEPPGRGTVTTKQLPRRTIDRISLGSYPYDAGGFAVPAWAREPWNGAFTTKQLPRRTVDTLVPNYLGSDFVGTAPADDAFRSYGERAAGIIADEIIKLPARERAGFLVDVLEGVKAGLSTRVKFVAVEYSRTGMPMGQAVRAAIASALSETLAQAVIQEGVPPVPLSGFFGAVGSGIKAVGKGVVTGVKVVGGTTGNAAASVVQKLGKLACTVTTSKAGQVATIGAATAGGNPAAGVAGAKVAAGLCRKGSAPAPAAPPAAPTLFGIPGTAMLRKYAVPLAVAAGGVGLIVLLGRKS